MVLDNNPYVGPGPVPKGRKLHGRDWEIDELVNLIFSEKITLLCSPSGAGKSSLINAGVIPQLVEQGFFVYPKVRLNINPEGLDIDTTTNRYIWSTIWYLAGSETDSEIPITTLNSLSLSDALQQFGPEDKAVRRLLIIDQGEELFTLDPIDRPAKKEFLSAIRKQLDDPYFFVLFAMREEYIAQLDELAPFVTQSAHFRIDNLEFDEAQKAIKGPARDYGVKFGDQLAKWLAENLGESSVYTSGPTAEKSYGQIEPVQIQLACRKMWALRNHDSDTITIDDFPDKDKLAAAVDSALADYYSEAVEHAAQKGKTAQPIVREWIRTSLITKSGLRTQVSNAELREAGIDTRIVQELEEWHLLRSEKRGNRIFYELAHDRLVAPILAESDKWRRLNLQDFQVSAEVWDKTGDRDTLLTRAQLDRTERWVDSHSYSPSPIEARYIYASRQRIEKRDRTRIFTIVTIALIVAMAATVEIMHRKSADDENKMFVQAKLDQAALFVEIGDYRSASAALVKAETSKIPISRRPAAEILRRHVQNMTVQEATPIKYADAIVPGLTSAALSDDWLFISGKYGSAFLVDRRSSRYTSLSGNGPFRNDWVTDPVFFKGKNRVMANTLQGNYFIWEYSREEDGPSAEIVTKFHVGRDLVDFSSLTPNEERLFVLSHGPCTSDGLTMCSVVEVASISGELKTTVFETRKKLFVVQAISNNQAVLGGDNEIFIIDLTQPDEIAPIEWHGSVQSIVANPDYSEIAVGTVEGVVSFLPILEGPTLGKARNYSIANAPVRTMSYFGNDSIVVGGDDQNIWVIDVETGAKLRVFDKHQRAVTSVSTDHQAEAISVSHDGKVLSWNPAPYEAFSVIDMKTEVLEYCQQNHCNGELDDYAVSAVALSPDLDLIAAGFALGGYALYSRSRKGLLYLQEPSKFDRSELRFKARAPSVKRIAIDQSGKFIGTAANSATIFKLETGVPVAVASEFLLPVSAVAFLDTHSEPRLVAASWDGRFAVLSEGKETKYYPNDPPNKSYTDRVVDRDLNSVTVDCSGTRITTTTNLGPNVWQFDNGEITKLFESEVRSPLKIVWAQLWNKDSKLLDSGFAGTRRYYPQINSEPEPDYLPGHFAEVDKIVFGPYGLSAVSIDRNGELRIRSLESDHDRDILAIHLPSKSGETPIKSTRDFEFRCTTDLSSGHIGQCAIAAPLGTRPAVLFIDLGDSLSTDHLFPDFNALNSEDKINSCATLSLHNP